ncbi:MAG: GtrA family protein [Anaerolineae bacterium]|nr:GtrA family protein [Anaerolineae bacterium]
MAQSSARLLNPNYVIKRVSVKVGGEKSREVERFIKFLIVGAIGAAIDLGLSNFLMKFVFHVTRDALLPVMIASACGFIAAVSSNFVWNRYWTYPDSRSRPIARQLGQFFVVNAVGLGIRMIIVSLFYVPAVWLTEHFFSDVIHVALTTNQIDRIGANVVVMLALVVVLFWNFFVNRHWTYGDVK